MRISRFAVFLIVAAFLGGCATAEENSWTTGVPREDAIEISREIRASLGVHKIYSFFRWSDGKIAVATDLGTYTATRVGHTWKFTEAVLVTDYAFDLTRR
jgi:hypothetical protein